MTREAQACTLPSTARVAPAKSASKPGVWEAGTVMPFGERGFGAGAVQQQERCDLEVWDGVRGGASV